ncbi:MAG: hypothetical protein K2I49_01275 [Ureaplasma sp.]|nr:hypothetical protein [Ureaplasma sp.]
MKLMSELKNISSEILNYFKDKILEIKFLNKNNIHNISVKFDLNFIPHSLGIDKIPYFSNLKKKGKILNNLINNDVTDAIFSKLSKNDINNIKQKIYGWKAIFSFIKNNKSSLEQIRISGKTKFFSHECDFCIVINGGCLVLCKQEENDNKFWCFIRSIRYLKDNNNKINFIDDIKVLSFYLIEDETK